jgi:hypothetical protein
LAILSFLAATRRMSRFFSSVDRDGVVDVGLLVGVGDVVLGLPDDALRELLLLHDGQGDLLDDDRIARDRDGHVLGRDLVLLEDEADGLDDRGRVDDRPLDDGVVRQRLVADLDQLVGLLALLARAQLDGLDGVGPDVQPDHAFFPRESEHVHPPL